MSLLHYLKLIFFATGDPICSSQFQYSKEIAAACTEGRLAEDVVREQNKVKDADLLILQFPLHWMSFPAILQGWFERVFTDNFAFVLANDPPYRIYDEGCMKVSCVKMEHFAIV